MSITDLIVSRFGHNRFAIVFLIDGDVVCVSAIIDGMEPVVSPAFDNQESAMSAMYSHIENSYEVL